MGDFTRLQFEVHLKKDISTDYIAVIHYMMNQSVQDIEGVLERIEQHELFSTPRWRSMLGALSSSLDVVPLGKYNHLVESDFRYTLHIFSVFKDSGEIRCFFNWIHPFIDETWLTYLGTVMSDAFEHPKLIYFHPKGISFVRISCEEIEHSGSTELQWSIDPNGLNSIS